MKLSKLHLIVYALLGIICMLVGTMIGQFNYYQTRIAEWRLAMNRCLYVNEKQEKIIEDTMSVFKR